jgi:hypothetical protein
MEQLVVQISLSLILMLGMLWLVFRRPDKKRLVWRTAASVLVVASIVVLAIRPHYTRTVPRHEAALLTLGTNKDSLSRWLGLFPDQPLLFVYDSAVQKEWNRFSPQFIPDVALLRRKHPDIQTLHVFGYGLPAYDLVALDSIRLVPHLTKVPAGIQAVDWNRKLVLGQPLVVQGLLETLPSTTYDLSILSVGVPVDSVKIMGKGKVYPFQLQTIPKAAGRYVFEFQVKAAGKLIRQEKIPFEVLPPALVRLLILEATPSFETRFLKNYLADAGHSIALRTTISKEKYRTEFVNRDPVTLNRVTTDLLDKMDLALMDIQTLQSLSASEQAALLQATQKKGLGLLVTIGSDAPLSRVSALVEDFSVYVLAGVEEQKAQVHWLGAPKGTHSLELAPLLLESSGATRPIVRNEQGKTIAAVRQKGLGRVGVSLTGNTYAWVLEGKPEVHASYWTYIVNELTHRKTETDTWTIQPDVPIVDEPVTLAVTKDTAQVPKANVDSTQIYLAQHLENPFSWEATFWPDRAGWHTVQTANGAPYWWYVFQNGDWQDRQYRENAEATSRAVIRQSQQSFFASHTENGVNTQEVPVPSIWFYLTFLLGCGYLWLERKL